MDSLTALAFDSYVETGIEGAVRLSVPSHVIGERLAALHHLVAPRSREKAVLDYYRTASRRSLDYEVPWLGDYFESLVRLAEVEEWAPDDVQRADSDEQFEVREAEGEGDSTTVESSVANGGGASGAPEPPTPDVLEFITDKRQHGLARGWEFHKGDADPYPSVPHGHERLDRRARDWPKLDVYRGFVYDETGAELKREPRGAIVALWNNAKFRTFAREALTHALAEDKTLERRLFDERGIRDPHLLPGERGKGRRS